MSTNLETHTCYTCGHTWRHGQHGGHRCADLLIKKIVILREALGELLDPPQGTDIRDRITKGRFALEATKGGV